MPLYQTAKSDGFSLTAYCGDAAVLLAFNLEKDRMDKLAGFAVKAVTPNKGPYATNEYWLKNRLNFKEGVYREKKLTPDKWVDSNKAPFQMFHWVHFPSSGPGQYRYIAYPCYFKADGIELGKGAPVDVDLNYTALPNMELGFTRGYISSQAYADRFHNAGIGPSEKTYDFDTKKYRKQYEWLGGHARKILFDFLGECVDDPSTSLDVFSFDFYEPDILKFLLKMKGRVRVFQDNAKLHTGSDATEPRVAEALKANGAEVKAGRFHRLAHNKVMIMKKDGKPVKVLTGSANFSLRGLYVQANSILTFDDPFIAGLYEEAFEEAFKDDKKFKYCELAGKWHDAPGTGPASLSFSFSPHKTAFTLDSVSDAIKAARSSVLFAMMETGGGGPAIEALKNIADRENVLSLGTVQKKGQLEMFKQGKQNGVASFSYISKNVPDKFQKEWSGGAGQSIHHKFVVCDFNERDPVVFCGSSNLAKGGETSNGDNLLAIRDADTANHFAIEALRLYDHYRFRTKQEKSSSKAPMMLDDTDGWVKPFYDKKDIKCYQRQLLCTYV
jgi:hypothetical protein